MTATASDPDGEVAKVSFYLGKELICEQTEAPYSCTVENFVKGENVIRAVATDNEGNTGSSKKSILVEEPTGTYMISKVFNSAGSVPEGWTTYDGEEKRVGFSSGYSRGSRVFNFTGATRDFDWGLYTRNVTGEAKAGYARYADKNTSVVLTLYPGNYQLLTRVANWNIPEFSPVTAAIETIDGEEVYAETFTPTVNIGNSASNDFKGVTMKTITFDIHEKGRYMVTFYTNDGAWADLVVAQTALYRKGNVSSVEDMEMDDQVVETQYYNMAGLCVEPVTPGMYIKKSILKNGQYKSRVVVVK